MRWSWLVFLVACGDATEGRRGRADDARVDADTHIAADVDERPRLQQWIGAWLVEQPMHALYESTVYWLDADGSVRVGVSEPNDCSGHLEKHCVTGSVGRGELGDPSCVFGSRWWTSDEHHVAFTGVCSDGTARDIVLALDGFTVAPQGFMPSVESVGGETGWVHDNWEWRFSRCMACTE